MEGEAITPAPRSGAATLVAALNLTRTHAKGRRRATRRSMGANIGWEAGLETALHADSRKGINSARGAAAATPMVEAYQDERAEVDKEDLLGSDEESNSEGDNQEDVPEENFGKEFSTRTEKGERNDVPRPTRTHFACSHTGDQGVWLCAGSAVFAVPYSSVLGQGC